MSCSSTAAFIPDLASAQAVPDDGILSRTMYRDETVKAVLVGMDAGQQLSEHTASRPAIVHILQDRGHLTLGDEAYAVGAGAWVHMPARLRHSLRAETPLVLLLLLLGQAAAEPAPGRG